MPRSTREKGIRVTHRASSRALCHRPPSSCAYVIPLPSPRTGHYLLKASDRKHMQKTRRRWRTCTSRTERRYRRTPLRRIRFWEGKAVEVGGRCANNANYTWCYVRLTRLEPATNGTSKILSFSGDAEDEEEDPVADLFAEVPKPEADADADVDDDAGDGEGESEGGDERSPRMISMLRGRSSTLRVRYTRSIWTATT